MRQFVHSVCIVLALTPLILGNSLHDKRRKDDVARFPQLVPRARQAFGRIEERADHESYNRNDTNKGAVDGHLQVPDLHRKEHGADPELLAQRDDNSLHHRIPEQKPHGSICQRLP